MIMNQVKNWKSLKGKTGWRYDARISRGVSSGNYGEST